MRLCLCLAFAVCLASTLPAVEATGDWRPLLDGESLDGWVQRGGQAAYRVEDGTIVGTTRPATPNSFLCTERHYADFELEYAFKVDPQLNSGVQIRSNSRPEYKDGRVHGYQVEIDPSQRAWTGGLYEEGRRGWLYNLRHNPPARRAFRQGEWNAVRVRAVGPSIRTWLNGVPAAHVIDSKTTSGFIGLQVHSTKSEEPLEVRWRDLRIRELESGSVNVPVKEAFVYHTEPLPPPEGAPDRYARSAFIHPLRAPNGEVLTRIHAPDHVHHMGLWHAWTKTEFRGRPVDFWNLGKGEGTVRHKELLVDFARTEQKHLAAWLEHVAFIGGEAVVVLNELLDVKAHGDHAAAWPHYTLDYRMLQHCATDEPLELPPHRYGGFVFRGREDWDKTNSDYLTSEGKTRADGHATRARWCIVHGLTPSGEVSLLFMSHPENRDHPERMRLWDQGPIFFNYCPVQETGWTLEPGEQYLLRYRVVVSDGRLTPHEAERLWGEWVAAAAADGE